MSGDIGDLRLPKVRRLLLCLEQGDAEGADQLVGELARVHEQEMFQEVGRLTRELHQALVAFRSDSRLAQLADGEITDAKERLSYVIEMTEKAATCTLAAVENARPLCEAMRNAATPLREQLLRFLGRRMEVEEFRAFCRELDEFLALVHRNSADVAARLSEVLMAQTFQDLSGQLIRRVIQLVEDVEQGLVNLVRVSGQRQRPDAAALDGPQVPALRGADAVCGQDEVDDLLSSLGF
jgi:chemotaxis protein CheZ